MFGFDAEAGDPMPRTKDLYLEILESLRRQIEASYGDGDRLPPQRMLARMHGVSQSTVQRAMRQLSREGMVVSRTGSGARLRLKRSGRIAGKMGSHRKRGLRIGVITTRLDWERYRRSIDLSLYKGLVEEAEKRGMEIVWVPNPHRSRTVPTRNLLDSARVPWNQFDVGLLLEICDAVSLSNPRLSRHRVIAVDQDATRFGIPSVSFDDFGAGCIAAKHLHDMGHRRFAVMNSASDPEYASDPCHTARRHGFEFMVERLRGCIRNDWRLDVPFRTRPLNPIVTERFSESIGHWAAASRDGRPTALFASDGSHLTEIIAVLADHGLEVPRDLSIVTVSWEDTVRVSLGNHVPGAGKSKPRQSGSEPHLVLTYVRMDLAALVHRTLDYVEALISDDSSTRRRRGPATPPWIKAPMILKPGASSAPPP